MKTTNIDIKHRMSRGFTLTELLVVVGTIAMLATLLLPALAQTGKDTPRIQCLNNLKRIGLAFRVWGDENGGKYPTAVSTANGGAQENIFSQAGGGAPAGYRPANVFCVMSNLLRTPKVLACPADSSKTSLPGDTSEPTGPVLSAATNWADFGIANLSYFVEGNASDKFPQMILTGDRNLGHVSSAAAPPPILKMNMVNNGYCPNNSSGVTGLRIISFPWAWSDVDIHETSGNLGMADGSVQQTSLTGLQNALTDTIYARGSKPLSLVNTIVNMP